MEFYHRAKELYGRGQYTQALAYLEKCLHEGDGLGQLKEIYSLVFCLTIELKDIQKFKIFFYQIKSYFLQQYEASEWVHFLKELCRSKNSPEFFIREEIISAYREMGLIQELCKECQIQLDRSIEKRRSNIDFKFFQSILGDHVEIYELLHKIYRGEYKEATEGIKKFKADLNAKKFDKVANFLASNIRPDECKRIEVKDIIISHLFKKTELDISCYDRKSVAKFEKSIIRNFINLMIIDPSDSNHIVNLLEFINLTENEKLRKDLLPYCKDIPELKENKKLRQLTHIPFKKKEQEIHIDEDYAMRSLSDNSIRKESADIEYLQSIVLRGALNTQEDEWFVEEFREIMTVLIEAGFYHLGLDVIKKIKGINKGQINIVDIYYFEVELYFFKDNYVDAIRVCQEALTFQHLSVSEEICFEYLKGESYFCLGERERAYKSFYKVFALDPSYRLARERLRIIEKENK